MLQVFNKADQDALKAIEQNPEVFMASIGQDSEKAGMKWDDLIMNFETMCDLTKLQGEYEMNEEQKKQFEEAQVSHKKHLCRSAVINWLKAENGVLTKFIEQEKSKVITARLERSQKL